MIDSKRNYLFNLIKMDCINLINKKNVDIEDLAFDLGISKEQLIKVFNEKCEDFTIYLKAYNILSEWEI